MFLNFRLRFQIKNVFIFSVDIIMNTIDKIWFIESYLKPKAQIEILKLNWMKRTKQVIKNLQPM